MVDAALAETGAVQQRLRLLPSRVVVYLLLAAGLFTEIGSVQVWARLCAGLDGLAVATPSPSALAAARVRVGVAPLRALFDLLRGPETGLRAPFGPGRGVLARPAGHRGGRHHPVLPGHPGEPDRVPQGRRLAGRHRVSDGPRAGAGGLRHPHDHRRGVRHRPDRRTRLRRRNCWASTRAGMIVLADRNFAAADLDHRAGRDRRRCAGPGQEQPPAAGLPGLARRVVRVPDRPGRGPGDHCPGHDHHQRGPPHRDLPAGHHRARPGRARRGDRRALPRALGDRDRASPSSSPPAWAGGCCAHAPRPGSPRRSTPC